MQHAAPRRSGTHRHTWLVLLLTACTFTACKRAPAALEPSIPPPPRLTVEQVAKLLPPGVKEREGWARDVLAALEAVGKREAVLHVHAPARGIACAGRWTPVAAYSKGRTVTVALHFPRAVCCLLGQTESRRALPLA